MSPLSILLLLGPMACQQANGGAAVSVNGGAFTVIGHAAAQVVDDSGAPIAGFTTIGSMVRTFEVGVPTLKSLRGDNATAISSNLTDAINEGAVNLPRISDPITGAL
jgi:hypothetical protein